jgi:hypothetical protein
VCFDLGMGGRGEGVVEVGVEDVVGEVGHSVINMVSD